MYKARSSSASSENVNFLLGLDADQQVTKIDKMIRYRDMFEQSACQGTQRKTKSMHSLQRLELYISTFFPFRIGWKDTLTRPREEVIE